VFVSAAFGGLGEDADAPRQVTRKLIVRCCGQRSRRIGFSS
jgi:hypothetical protein